MSTSNTERTLTQDSTIERALSLKDMITFLIAFAALIGIFMASSLIVTGIIGIFV